jgi:hypothetical protein
MLVVILLVREVGYFATQDNYDLSSLVVVNENRLEIVKKYVMRNIEMKCS